MTTTTKSLVELVQELPPDVAAEVKTFAEFLLAKRRTTATAGWPPDYFTDVIGSLPDFPDVDEESTSCE